MSSCHPRSCHVYRSQAQTKRNPQMLSFRPKPSTDQTQSINVVISTEAKHRPNAIHKMLSFRPKRSEVEKPAVPFRQRLSIKSTGKSHASERSSHVGFSRSIRNTFFSLRQRLICFSRAIAADGVVNRSNQTSRSQPYSLVNPSNLPPLCCFTRTLRSLVKPTYKTLLRFATK